jgi:hypothetical protein
MLDEAKLLDIQDRLEVKRPLKKNIYKSLKKTMFAKTIKKVLNKIKKART